MPTKSPPWSIDELILAMDLYVRRGQLTSRDPEVLELHELLIAMPHNADVSYPASFRNPNGVAMKLDNFAFHDPAASGGFPNGGKPTETVWEAYAEDRETLWKLANAIREAIVDPESAASGRFPDIREEQDDEAIEGRILLVAHRRRERSPALVGKRKAAQRKSLGQLVCEGCEVTESEIVARYGEQVGEVYECHHRQPLYTLTGTNRTRPSDLAVLCPTCHRAIHRISPIPTVEEFSAALVLRR